MELPKLGWVSRHVEGTIKNVTVSLRAGKWFISIQTERDVPDPVHPSQSAVGIDAGIVNLAALSTGEVIKPLNPFRKEEKRLAKPQRAQSKTKKHPHKNHRKKRLRGRVGKNWLKRQLGIQRKHAKIARRRKDHLHKASAAVSKNHATVVVEDLNIRNMSKSAAGTLENPGRNVAAKSGLDKSILDQAWGTLIRMTEYKLKRRGGRLIKVPPQFTSRRCPVCGHARKDNRRTQAKFKCLECGYENNAGLAAALNILAAGHAACACGGLGALGPA
jgi:putative transposase